MGIFFSILCSCVVYYGPQETNPVNGIFPQCLKTIVKVLYSLEGQSISRNY